MILTGSILWTLIYHNLMVNAMMNPELKERPFEQFILDLETALTDKLEADVWQEADGRPRKYDLILALVFFLLGIFWRTIFDWVF